MPTYIVILLITMNNIQNVSSVFLFGLLGKVKLGTAEVEEFIMQKYLVYLKHELSIY